MPVRPTGGVWQNVDKQRVTGRREFRRACRTRVRRFASVHRARYDRPPARRRTTAMGIFSIRRPPTTPEPPPPPLPPPPSTYQILEAGAFVGLQIGACAGVALSPAVWVAHRLTRSSSLVIPFYSGILPRSGAIGLVAGAVAGTAAAYNATHKYSESELQIWAHEGTEHAWLRRTNENMRSTQWTVLGAGTGAVFATPGPGSVIFTEAPWYWRLGGGCAVGVVAFSLGFMASCHPACRDLLPYLPEGMQPVVTEKDGQGKAQEPQEPKKAWSTFGRSN